MFKLGLIKFSSLIFFAAFMVSGCQSFEKRCLPDKSTSCKFFQSNWQTSIDQVVKANFPPDYGMYKAVIWNEDFDNAWVTKGREINITQRFLEKLNPVRRICVAAHELAHLKMGHYYSRIGIIIINSEADLPENVSPTNPTKDHYGSSNIDVPEGFGINQEVEADRMALKLIKKLGLNAKHYLDLLLVLQGTNVNPDSLIYHRIIKVKQLQ
jgi:hypothetical protein